ncbi:MAG TPA: hypothetical protein VGE09_06505 [Pseudoxanthomonas sp.]
METLRALWWRARLVYHMRRLGMYKRSLRALRHAWEESGDGFWSEGYSAGYSPLAAIGESGML